MATSPYDFIQTHFHIVFINMETKFFSHLLSSQTLPYFCRSLSTNSRVIFHSIKILFLDLVLNQLTYGNAGEQSIQIKNG